VVILDAKYEACVNERHRPHAVLWASNDAPAQVDYDKATPAEPA
jgi:hypothetical protein